CGSRLVLLVLRRAPASVLFPYTTLFRSYLLNLAGRIGEGEWQQVEDARHLDLTIEREGSTTVTARAADAAGNTSVVQRPVRIDTTAPELSVPFEAESRTVTVTADDELSGLARLEYRLDD